MAQDQGQERSEPASAKRQLETREQGRVPKSTDLVAAATLIAAMLMLKLQGEALTHKLVATLRFFLGDAPLTLSVEELKPLWPVAGRALLETVAPIVLVVAFVALAVLYFQIGWLFTLKPLAWKLNRLNPINGVKRLFGLSSLVKLGMSLFKTILVTWVAYTVISEKVGVLVGIGTLTHWQVLGLGADLVFSLAIRVGAVLLILGLLDLWYQRWKHNEDQKMTKQEVKEEMRQMEGDPVVRRRQRAVQMQLAMQRIRSAVPEADVVVTNPTELAVALKYDADAMTAPKVVAKGQGFLARRIREVAIEFGIPIVERKPLAQALYKTVEVGQEVPAQFYKAIAEILAYVYELAGKARRVQPVGAGA
jgi:flagellar biosynthetic protein FlhB